MTPGRPAHDREIYLEGVEEFNAGAFYAAHDRWEDLWLRNRSPARAFLQGLIQVAAGFHHWEQGRDRPCRALMREAIARLSPYAPAYLGLDVASLLLDLERARGDAEARGTYDPARVPRLRLTPPTLAEFLPHAGSAAGPPAKTDWLWQGEEAPDEGSPGGHAPPDRGSGE